MQEINHCQSAPGDREVDALLTRPYARAFAPDTQSGTYTAWILEFPGCVTQGTTVEAALENLEKAAHGWLSAALDLGQAIPEPLLEAGHTPWKGLWPAERR